MSWFSNALNDAIGWAGDQVRSIGTALGNVAHDVWSWLSDNVSGLPLTFFSMVGTTVPGWSFGGRSYFKPDHADSDVNALMSGSKWSDATITYSLPDSRSDYETFNPSASGFYALSAQNQTAVHDVMATVAGYVSVGVAYAGSNEAQIKVAGFTPGDTINRSHGYYPGVPVYGGDTWLTTGAKTDLRKGTSNFFMVLHELGHSLGLKHSHDSAAGLPKMSAARDTTEYTVMSYVETEHLPQSFMQYDIAALQAMYGADFATNAGETTYSWDAFSGATRINGVSTGMTDRSRIFLTIWDGGGIDTYDMSNFRDDALIDLSPGGFSRFSLGQLAEKKGGSKVNGNVYNAFQYKGDLRSLIENAVGGTGNDKIVGNQANNSLKGGSGRDELHGGLGNDSLIGGDGSDKLYGGAGADRLDGGADRDTVSYWSAAGAVQVYLWDVARNKGEAAGDSYVDIEVIDGSGHGDVLEGDSGHNSFWGDAGNDTLKGGAGDDTLSAGDGDDRLDGGIGADHFNGGAGWDTVSYWAAGGAVQVYLHDVARNAGEATGDTYIGVEVIDGSVHGDALEGNDAANVFWGDGGNDVLKGFKGVDTLSGGSGDDRLAGGIDADYLDGGDGFDVADYSGAGTGLTVDLVSAFRNTGEASGDILVSIEGVVGTAYHDQIHGGAGSDRLHGGAGDDVLEGRGGLGGDHLDGGAGFDYAVYWHATSGVVASLGNSMVNTGDAYGDTYESIEGLDGSNYGDALYGNWSGNSLYGRGGNDALSGDGGDDYIEGGDGVDTIAGGEGLDWLLGNLGRDYFRFDTWLGSANVDTLADFSVADDLIQLSRNIFSKVTGGSTLDAAAFTTGAAATSSSHRIVYNKTSGDLFYDADGSGMAAGQTKFASIGAGHNLTAYHFLLV